MASTLTTFADLLKERYADANMVEQLSMADEPLYSMLEKAGDANIAGSEFVVPIIYSNPQGVAGNYTDALANTSNIAAAAWHIVPGNHVGTVEIGDKVLKASRGNNGAILDNKRVEIDGLYTTMGESQAAHIWGNGGQSIGQIGTIVSTNVWELADKAQICNFEYGMEIVLSTGDGSSTSDSEVDSGNSTTVAAVDRNLGRITVTGSDISGEAVGDYIFREGEFYGDQYASNAIMTGVQAFVDNQTTLPTLWGVSNTVRAYDRERFGGCSVPDADVNGMALSARIKTLLAWMAGRYKSKVPTHGFLHPEDFQLLETELEARRITPEVDKGTQFGFMKLTVVTGRGAIPIYSDRHVPKGNFFALRLEDWKLHWLGPALLHVMDEDGAGEILRKYDGINYEYRLLSYPALSNRAPKNSGRVSLYD